VQTEGLSHRAGKSFGVLKRVSLALAGWLTTLFALWRQGFGTQQAWSYPCHIFLAKFGILM
jgi:hypothetical protein